MSNIQTSDEFDLHDISFSIITSKDRDIINECIHESFVDCFQQIYDYLQKIHLKWIIWDADDVRQRGVIRKEGLKKGEYVLASQVETLIDQYLKDQWLWMLLTTEASKCETPEDWYHMREKYLKDMKEYARTRSGKKVKS